MATILIHMLQEPGHLLPSYKITKELQRRGHKIIYMGSKEFKKDILSYGFTFEEVPETNKSNVLKTPGWAILVPKIIMRTIKNIKDYSALCETVTSNVKKIVKKYKPDLILLDDLHTPYIIALDSYNIPVVMISTYLSQDKDTNVPPLHSTYIPKMNILSKLWIELLWLKVVLLFRLHTYFGYYAQNKTLAKNSNFPLKKRINHNRSLLFGIKDVPTVVLCPREFDFPREEKPSRFYVGPNMTLDRKPVPFDRESINHGKPVVYCALGTQAHFHFEGCVDFYKKVIEVFRNRPDFTLVISIWKELDISTFYNLPDNVKLFNVVPQIEVLKKASLMITHGGLGSIKEAITFGVPMLVYPINLTSDQNGNAARVVYRKIGLRGNIRKDSLSTINSRIDRMLTTNQFQKNIKSMQKIFIEKERNFEVIPIIERYINPGNQQD